MTAHISVPALDPSGTPATLSAPILTNLLRKEMGIHGIIASDALDMGGITQHWNAAQAAVKAIGGRADVLAVCRPPEEAVTAIANAGAPGHQSAASVSTRVSSGS